MEIVYHIGAHATDEDRLLGSLAKNRAALAKAGVAVPPTDRYRLPLRELLNAMGPHGRPTEDARDMLLDQILEDQSAERLVMANPSFVCIPARVFEHNQLYHLAGARVSGLTRLFPEDDIEIFLGLRNPATFIPAVQALMPRPARAGLLERVEPFAIAWSDMLTRMREAAPAVRFTVWCNEDSPLLWSQLIRALAGIDATSRIAGGFDLLAEIMAPEGLGRFTAYVKDHPPQSEDQMRRVIAAFLDKYVLEDEVEEELDLPGWTEDTVEALTTAYEEDLDRISAMPGVTFLEP
ncbi:MAG: hypothetical protein ACU0CI_11385 [Shimia sp.]